MIILIFMFNLIALDSVVIRHEALNYPIYNFTGTWVTDFFFKICIDLYKEIVYIPTVY